MPTQTILRQSKCTPWSASPMFLKNPGTPPEEPLSLSGMQGFFLARPGLLLNGRYEIMRKLGQGQFSTTWLVSDSKAPAITYRAVKVLTVHATEESEDGRLLELKVMETIRTLRSPLAVNLPYLFDHFAIKGLHGKHLCLVLPVLSTDISSFRKTAPSQKLESPTVKVIVAQVVRALVVLHDAAIMHGDLKPDNVLFSGGTAPKLIQKLLEVTPPAIEGEVESSAKRYPIIHSQPIPHRFKWDDPGKIVELYFVQLVDLGNARWVGTEPTKKTYTDGLRAPEIILGANLDTKVDVWALGCMTFELLTGHSLFDPESGQTRSVEDDHLAKMIEVTGETFSKAFLTVGRKSRKYFNEEGKFRRIDQLLPFSLEQAMMNRGVPQAEALSAAEFIRSCLHLNPQDRSTAKVLRAHPWLKKAFMCCSK